MIKNNDVYIGEIPAARIAQQFGTPLYVYDESIIRARIGALKNAFTYPRIRILYAAKANTNLELLRIVREEGCGIDAVSPGEIRAALKAGYTPEQIVFTATSVTNEEMRFARSHGVMINVDSLSQLERYGKLFPNTAVSIRVNPAVGAGHHDHVITGGPDSKFGIWVDDLPRAREIAKEHSLVVTGLHQHIGSGVLDVAKYMQAVEVLLTAAKDFPDLDTIDFGGGIGVPYRPTELPIDIAAFGRAISAQLRAFAEEYGRDVTFAFEPGRYIVAESGFLLCEVNTIKSTPKFTFAGVNTGFNHLIRPMAYGSYHPIYKASGVVGGEQPVVIAGNICETGDVFTVEGEHVAARSLPVLSEGDIIVIGNAGAYGYSMSSNYNTRPRPAEILVSGSEVRVIREAEKVEDLL